MGLSVAEAAARRGLRCVVLDRGDPGAASWASAGMIAPLAEVPGDSEVERRFFELCRRSRDLWRGWAERLEDATGMDLGYDREGALVIERDDALAQAAQRVGEEHRRLDAGEMRRLVPDLDPALDGGLHLPGEHRVDNRRVCRALLRRLGDLGVEMRRGASVERVEGEGDGARLRGNVDGAEFDLSAARALVAAGAWTPKIAGIDALAELPIRPLRGQMLRLGQVSWPFGGSLRGDVFYAVRRRENELLVGATEDRAGYAPYTTAGGLGLLVDWIRSVLPGMAERPVAETWAGLRPTPPDGRPLLGPLDESGATWVAAGHHRNGILLTPWTASAMARWIVEGEEPEPDVRRLFDPHRFAPAGDPSPAGSPC